MQIVCDLSLCILSAYRLQNIYVYCSREGLPDSLRNPKRHPKRKRPSKRCDCRWRMVLNETKDTHIWRFRKSQSPESCFHNHELLRPEEIEKGWPKQVLDYICELARERLSTPEIRAQVQTRFSDISWNERRFYNRLSEERQRIRQRETVARAHQLTELWTKVCMAAAGSEELTKYALFQGEQLLRSLCEMARVDTESFSCAPEFESTGEDEESDDLSPETPQAIVRHSWQDGQPVPKGYTTVVVPEHKYIVRVHNQRSLNEIQSHRALRRSFSLMAQDEPDNDSRRKFVKLDNVYPPPPTHQHQQPPSIMYTPTSQVSYEASVPIAPYMAMPQTPVSTQHAAHSAGYCPSSSGYCASSPENGLQYPPLDASSATVASTPSPPNPKAIKRRASQPVTPYFMAPPPLHQQPIFPNNDKIPLLSCTASATRHHSLTMEHQQPVSDNSGGSCDISC